MSQPIGSSTPRAAAPPSIRVRGLRKTYDVPERGGGTMAEAGRWPVAIYPPWLRAALTLLVPVAFAITIPAETLVGRLEAVTLVVTVGFAVVFLVGSRIFWRLGLRHYTGASA